MILVNDYCCAAILLLLNNTVDYHTCACAPVPARYWPHSAIQIVANTNAPVENALDLPKR